jgi:hypothetical protein
MKTNLFFIALLCALIAPLAGCKKKAADAASDSDANAPGESASPGAPGDAAKPRKPAQRGGPVELKIKWPVGARYVQRLDMAQNSETRMAMAPKPIKQETTMGQEFALTVLAERPGGGREVEMEFMDMEMMSAMGDKVVLNFDSKGETGAEAQNPMAATFRKMIGMRIKFLLDASHKVEKVEGFQEFRAKMSGTSSPQAQAMMNSIFSEDYFKQMVRYADSLPPKPVSPGESWPVQTEIPMGPLGTMVMDLTYTYTGMEEREKRQCAALVFGGTMKSKPGQAAGTLGSAMNITDGKTKGTTWFDPALGMAVETAMSQNMTMEMNLPGLPNASTNRAPAGMKMTNVLSQKINFKLVEVGTAAK